MKSRDIIRCNKLLKAPLSNLNDYANYRHTLKALEFHNDDSVLDIGCGSGIIEHLLEDNVKRIVGIDISKETIDFLKKHYKGENVKFDCMDITKEVSGNFIHAFDKIICVDVLEHVLNKTAAIRFIASSLKRDGKAVLTFPVNNLSHGHTIVCENVPNLFIDISHECSVHCYYLIEKNSVISWLFKKVRRLFPMREADDFAVTVSFDMYQKHLKNFAARLIYNITKIIVVLLSYFGNKFEQTEEGSAASRCLIIMQKL